MGLLKRGEYEMEKETGKLKKKTSKDYFTAAARKTENGLGMKGNRAMMAARRKTWKEKKTENNELG